MRVLLTALLCMLLSVPAFAAMQHTTVLSAQTSFGKNAAVIPVIDGSNEADLEKQANNIIRDKAEKLAKKTGGQVTYEVTMNRPSLVSILLKAEGSEAVYQGVNIDLTTGREFTMGDFFTETEQLSSILGSYEDFVFGENGVYLRRAGQHAYNDFVPYSKIITSMRIGSAGRLVQIAKLTQNAADKTLHIKAGNLLALKLDSNPSTGYRWEAVADEGVKKVGSSFIMPREDNRTGVTGTEIMVLAAQKAGTYLVTMEYKRPWEKQGLNKFSFTIVVED